MTHAKATSWKAEVVSDGGTVSDFRLAAVSDLWDALDAAGITTIDNLWLPQFVGNAIAAKVDVAGHVRAVPVGGPVWDNATGWTTTPTAYLNLGTHGGSNYAQDAATFGFLKLTNNAAATLNCMGAINTSGVALSESFLHYAGGGAYCGVNGDSVSFNTTPATTNGLFLVQRVAASGAGAVTLSQDGSVVATWTAVVSNGVPNQNYVLGGMFDTGGTFSNGGDGSATMDFGMVVIGGVFDKAAFHTAIADYIAVGADPPEPVDDTTDIFQPFGSLFGSTDLWEVGLPTDPAALRAHLGKDLLLTAEPFEAGMEGSLDLDLFPPFGSLPEGWSTTAAERRTIYIAATRGRSTANNDEPPAQYVPGRLQPFNFGARLFEGTDPLSRPGANEGVIGLTDPDGTLDDLIGRVWDGTPLTLKRGSHRTRFKDWPVVARLRSAGLIRDLDQKQLQLRDLGWLLTGDLHDETYLGSGELEGVAGLAGRLKPWALGYNFNVEPILLSAADQIFQWSLSSSVELIAFRHGGISIDIGTDYPTYADLAAATIPDGECATCLAHSLVRPNLELQYDVRVEVIGDADVVNGHPAPTTRAAIIRRIATHRGQNRLDDNSEIDLASFNRMEAFHTAPVGWFFGAEKITKLAAIYRALDGVLGWARVRPDGRFSIGWVVAPESMAPVVTFVGSRDDVGKPRLVSTSAPRRGTRVSWRTNNAPQDRSSLSPLVSDADADLYKQPASFGQRLDPSIATQYPTAALVTVDEAGFKNESDAVAEATRHQAIFSIERNRWARDIQVDPFFDILGSGVTIADDPASAGGHASSVQLCVAIEAVGTSVQTLEFFT